MENSKLIEILKFNDGDSRTFYCAKDQEWSLQAQRELWNDYHIIMNNGVVAVKVNGTIISLCAEDDGSIAVDDEHDLRFSVYWVDELIKALELAKKKIQDLKKEN